MASEKGGDVEKALEALVRVGHDAEVGANATRRLTSEVLADIATIRAALQDVRDEEIAKLLMRLAEYAMEAAPQAGTREDDDARPYFQAAIDAQKMAVRLLNPSAPVQGGRE